MYYLVWQRLSPVHRMYFQCFSTTWSWNISQSSQVLVSWPGTELPMSFLILETTGGGGRAPVAPIQLYGAGRTYITNTLGQSTNQRVILRGIKGRRWSQVGEVENGEKNRSESENREGLTELSLSAQFSLFFSLSWKCAGDATWLHWGFFRKVDMSSAREPSLGKGTGPGVHRSVHWNFCLTDGESLVGGGLPCCSGWWRMLLVPQGANQLHLERMEHSPPYIDLVWFSLSDSLMKALGVGCHGYAGFNI